MHLLVNRCIIPHRIGSKSIGVMGELPKPNVEVTMCLGPMPPDASVFPGGIPAKDT